MKKKNLIINILKMIIVFVLFLFSGVIKLGLFKLCGINVENVNNSLNYLFSIIVYLILLAIYIFLYRKDFPKEWKNFKSNLAKNFDTSFKYYFIGLILMVVFNVIINYLLNFGQSQNEQAVQQMIKASPVLMIIFAGFIGPVIEELVFRKSLKNVFSNKWLFVIISGIVFGLVHVNSFKELLYILPYGSLGAMFAYMDYKIDSTFPSCSMHMMHNTVLIVLSIISKTF